MKKVRVAYLIVLAVAPLLMAAERPRIDLDGPWDFRLDPNQRGVAEDWAGGSVEFPDSIQVPGSWGEQGYGEPDGILRHHYSGHAWYLRRVPIPANWKGKNLQLKIGGAHRRTRLFVNGKPVGEEYDRFSAPFDFDVTSAIVPGAANTIALRIDNSGPTVESGPREQEAPLPVGMLNYITNWGGIYGHVELEAAEPVRVRDVAVSSDVSSRITRFRVHLTNDKPVPAQVRVQVQVEPEPAVGGSLFVDAQSSSFTELQLSLPDAELWSPENPKLYTAVVSVLKDGRELDRVEQRFGVREITTRGSVLLLNGRPLYLRGYGDDNIEVLNGFPPASREVYRERLRLAKSYGFNSMRFHSMTPPSDFFSAADEVGMLVMAELPAAYTQYFFKHRPFLRQELKAVLLAHRNHPSLLSLAFGNEFNLNWLDSDVERESFLASIADFYRVAKDLAPVTLIMSNDGFIMKPTDMASILRGLSDEMPIVRHEFGGYYCSLPDISLIDQFSGVIDPLWLKEKRRWVEANGLSDQYPALVRNSQLLQHLGHKFQIERVRLDPSATGYHYWLIVDFPGGTGEGNSWEEGWFDYFWQPKAASPQEGRTLNSPLLLMIGEGVEDRTLWNDRIRTIDVLASNYSEAPVRRGLLKWELKRDGERIAGSEVSGIDIDLGKVKRIGQLPLGPVPGTEAAKLSLVIRLTDGDRAFENSWDFWSFPRVLTPESPRPVVSRIKRESIHRLYPFIGRQRELPPEALLITPTLDREAMTFLESGGRVWVLGGREQFGRSGEGRFFPASGGALCTFVLDHTALEGFPRGDFCDLQYFNLLDGGWDISLDRWPSQLKPIIGGVRARSSFLSERKNLARIGYVLEASVGQGKLLVTSLRIEELLDEAYPEVIYLFDRLLRYATGPRFAPEVQVSPEELESVLR